MLSCLVLYRTHVLYHGRTVSRYINKRPLFCRNHIQPSNDGGTRAFSEEETLSSLRDMETAAQTSMEEALVKIIKVQRRTATVIVVLSASSYTHPVTLTSPEKTITSLSHLWLWIPSGTPGNTFQKQRGGFPAEGDEGDVQC